ncbi:MAG: PEPxxWA-CTERM sorting domain-containing protein [Phenylobacterium sp.]
MRFQTLMAAAVAAAGVMIASGAHATVVNFDDLSGSSSVADGYGGINWGGAFTYYDSAQDPYTPHSGRERIYGSCDCTTDNVFTFAAPVVFDGAWFAGVDGTHNDFQLSLGGVVVATSASLNMSSTPTFLASGYSGLVDKVDIQTSQPGYWIADDITYNGGAGVPEPAAWAMMLAGFGGLGAVMRRRRAVSGLATA